jgi:hypothetical protein
MTKNLIGSDPSQVPVNGSLGTMAFQDAEDVAVGDMTVGGAIKFADGTTQMTAPVAVTWGNLSGKPTTLGGYGITDAIALTGGIATGEIGVKAQTGYSRMTLDGVASQDRYLGFMEGTKIRWIMNAAATNGHLVFGRFDATGTYQDTPLLLNRDSGQATFSVRPLFGGAAPWDSSNLPNPLDKSGGTLTGMLITTSAAGAMASDYTGSLTVKNAGGTGDTDMSMVVFHNPGYVAAKLGLRSDGYFGLGGGSVGTWRWHVNTANGDMTAAGNVIAYSDKRLKQNIKTITNALLKVKLLRGVEFRRKDIPGKPKQIGLIAQEVQGVLPEVVTENAEGTLGVAYANIVGLLVEAVKELSARVDELEGAA